MFSTFRLLSCILSVVFLCVLFVAQKAPKTPGTRAQQSLAPLVRELHRQYNSSVPRLPFQSFLPYAGCCGTHCVRQFLKKYNCRTAFERSSHNGLHTAGIYTMLLTVPVFFNNTIVHGKCKHKTDTNNCPSLRKRGNAGSVACDDNAKLALFATTEALAPQRSVL